VEIPAQYCAPFHESANRPRLLLGCEPAAIAGLTFSLVALCFSVPTWWGICGSVALFFFLRQVLQEMAKADPFLITVYLCSRLYHRGFWTAQHLSARTWRTD